MRDDPEFNIKFLELVNSLSCLYDINNDDYHRNQIQERSWSKIEKYIVVGDGKTDQWRQILETNILGLNICTREAYQSMKSRGVDDGHIIHINR
ncbi:unnamed protein product [Timema podura]|uniref:Uncharacterized protein n=1 Tax=Timema podura TaxID=61482 RepID=A0ABN7NK19_TIMPD|nr:unnamed protein product [Timema podura]